jgi:heptosyltransferase-2/heptosyltransferase-3
MRPEAKALWQGRRLELAGGQSSSGPEEVIGERAGPIIAGRGQGEERAALHAPVSAEDVKSAGELLARHAISPTERLVALQPGTGALLKRWDARAFAEVAVAMAREHGARVLLVGTADERELAGEIARLAQAAAPEVTPVVLAGETTWSVLAAVLDRCALVAGLDSGTLHLAVARGRPSVAIFGPVDPRLFGPWGDPCGTVKNPTGVLLRTPSPWGYLTFPSAPEGTTHAVVAASLPCQPCGRLDYCALQPLGGPLPVPCLAAVSPEAVVAAARRVVQEKR